MYSLARLIILAQMSKLSLVNDFNRRISFFLAGNYLGDIMACALSDSAPLAIAGMEVLECIARGGLAAPNDVLLNYSKSDCRPFQRLWRLKQVLSPGCVISLRAREFG